MAEIHHRWWLVVDCSDFFRVCFLLFRFVCLWYRSCLSLGVMIHNGSEKMKNRNRLFPYLAVGLLATAGLGMAQDQADVHPWRSATDADQAPAQTPAVQDQQQNQYPVQN